MELAKRIAKIQQRSNDAWEMAVDTAGSEYSGGSDENQSEMQSLANSCDSCYDAAITAIESGDYPAALEQLKTAKSLESEGGDCSCADRAIEILQAQ